jgi:hypothetical protein
VLSSVLSLYVLKCYKLLLLLLLLLLRQVMDPGPGLLLVVSGSGHVSVKAGVVVDANIVDEAELHPGGLTVCAFL